MAKPLLLNWPKPLRWSSLAAATCCLVACFVVSLSGCRAVDNAQVDVLERELRQQEDYIYELENYVMEYSEKLRDCRSCATPMTLNELPTKPKSTPRGPTLADDSAITPPPSRRQGRKVTGPPDVPAPTIDAFELPPTLPAPAPATRSPAPATEPATTPPSAPETSPVVPAPLEAPGLEIGPTSELQWKGAAPIATAPAGDEAPPFIPDPADYQIDADESPLEAQHASIDADRSGAHAIENAAPPSSAIPSSEAPELIAAAPALPPPDDAARLTAQRLKIRRVLGESPASEDEPTATAGGSLLVVVEALNATDEPVDANGEVSLMVMAGENQESLKRIDRWDFTSEEAIAAWQSSQLGDGLHLQLPLGEGPLPEGPLELWARLVTSGGEKLLTKVPFVAAELEPLEEALAEGPQPTDAAIEPIAEPQTLGANGDAVANGGSLNAVAPATAAEPPPARTKWRTSSEPLSPQLVEGFSSTAGGASNGWTRQGPGRTPAPAAPRMATGGEGRPRWQQGSAETPRSGEPSGAWAPFR